MPETTLEKDLDEARRKLLDTGTRSRLIHINRTSQRANSLNIINEQSDDIFKILRKDGQKMRFKAMGKDKGIDGEEMLLAVPDKSLEPGARRYTDKFLETPLGPEALERRLLRLASDAKTAEEEQGLNILYLALGFLRWKESANSEVVREAPLILLPVSLLRNKNTSSYNIQVRDDDLTTNLSLQKRLQEDFSVSLPEIDETDEWCPSNYFTRIKKAVSAQPSWEIDANGMQLGFFSFAKLLMLNDLNASAWPDDSLINNNMLESLLRKGFETSEPLFGVEDKLDQLLSPADIIQIIDADASQTKVIEEVRNGSSLVVQGPPGTGKSQTITNIIAAAVHDGKSVLFVAEKMAALSVVHDRLVKAGLRDICLEIHSKTANKKALAQEIGRTLRNSDSTPSPVGDVKKLEYARDKLNKIADVLHQPMPENGESPFQTMSELIRYIGADKKFPEISRDGLEKLSREQRSQICDSIKQFTEALSHSGPREQHPYRGTKELDLQPPDIARLKNELAQAVKAIIKLQNKVKKFSELLRRDLPESVAESIQLADDIMELKSFSTIKPEHIPLLHEHCDDPHAVEALTIGSRWRNARQKADDIFTPPAWSADLSTLRPAIARGCSSCLSRWFGGYRRVSADFATLLSQPLPKKPSDRLALVDKLLEIQELRQKLHMEESWLSAFLGNLWHGERTLFGELLTTCKKLGKLKKSKRFATAEEIVVVLQEFSDPVTNSDSLKQFSEKVLEKVREPIKCLDFNLKEAGIRKKLENVPLVDLRRMFKRMHDSTARYTDWVILEQAIQNMQEEGVSAIVKTVLKKKTHPEDAIDEFLYACAEARWESARKSSSELKRLQFLDRHKEVKRFRDLESNRIEETKNLVLNHHRDKIPRGNMGEMGIIRGEIARKRGHKPIRRLMENVGGMIQRIKPVLLMSPLSVAQFLPPGKIDFDLLVIDEASQVRPEDAFGVIARAKQIVVIGDQKQLPPTSFFDRLVDEGEDDKDEETMTVSATEMESILSLCEARGMRQQMLEWHYRSRDPSLIRVSNAEFYENNLVLLPSPLEHDENYGLKFRRVDGFYSRGSTRTNKVEAQAVVKAMAQHAKDWPDYSLGVATFSKAQADMMRQILEFERRQNDVLDKFLREGQKEDVFVKNIENVQGDERDVIFVSVGYGPKEANGRLASMNFGPINKEGGERRLNVLFSRARIRCEVFASFEPEDMDINRIRSDGPRVLKKFLDFAKTGKIEEHHPTGLAADSPFEEDVARFIRSLGYKADPQVGSEGFRIDIGVRHPDRPGQYIVAVECDGAAYHSALWARERDHLRQEILENLGWRFHRIWSTDWFHRCEQEKKRLREMLENVCASTLDGIVVPGTNARVHEKKNEKNIKEESVEPVEIDHVKVSALLYSRANVRASAFCEPHEASSSQLVELVEKIIRVEGPLHENQLARRISSAFGKEKTGRRIMEAVKVATKTALQKNQDLLSREEFLLTVEQEANPPVRDRRKEEGSLLRAEYLPPMEICAARNIVIQENGEMSEEETIRSIARLFGFKQVGKNLRERIVAALASGHPQKPRKSHW